MYILLMIFRDKAAAKKITLYALFVFLLFLAAGGYLYAKNLGKRLVVYKDAPIEATIVLSPSKIETTTDIQNNQTFRIATLTATVTNHTRERLTNVLLVIPSVGVGTIETPTTKRVTNLPQQGSDDVFTLGTIPSGKTKKAMVSLYALEPKTYTIKAWVYTKQEFNTATNDVLLEVQ